MRAVCCALLFAVASAAHAQTIGSMDDAHARFGHAEELASAHQWALALGEFREVHAYMESVGHPGRSLLIYDIALCLEQLGRDADAIVYYRRFLAEAPPDAEQRPEATRSLSELLARASLSASGFTLDPIGIGVAAAGLAAVVAGAIAGGFAIDGRDRIAGMCSSDGHCLASLAGWASDVQTLAGTADALLWGGLAIAAAGALIAVLLGNSTSAARALLTPGALAFGASW